jgi:hypothetical protein
MGDSVPPSSSPPEELHDRRKGDKIIKKLPKLRIPDFGGECTNDIGPEVSNIISFTGEKVKRARPRKLLRPTDKTMHHIRAPEGQRGGLRKYKPQECSLNPYLEEELYEQRMTKGNLVDAIIGGVRETVDVTRLNDEMLFAKGRGRTRLLQLELALRKGNLSDFTYALNREEKLMLPETVQRIMERLEIFALENEKLVRDGDVSGDELFHPVAKILIQELPAYVLRTGIRDAHVISIIRLLKDDATKRRMMVVLCSFVEKYV